MTAFSMTAVACAPGPTTSSDEISEGDAEALLLEGLPRDEPAAGALARAQRRCEDAPAPGTPSAVMAWNDVALEVLPVDPGLVVDSRAFAIVHAAIHDALNGVDRRYQPYTAELSSPGASADAAVAAAARDALVALSPSQTEVVEAAYAAALAAIPDGPARDAGVALGQQSARANLARRAGDGLATATEPVYVPTGEPGDYDFTPPFDAPPAGPLAVLPGWGRLVPFAVTLGDHRLPGPDPLRSLRYALDLRYTAVVGRLESTARSAEQTEIARFWFELSPIGWNRIAATIVRQQGADLWESARTMALVNFALADGYIVGFADKYHFRHWRPFTAIRRADTDGNPLTRADREWQPLFSTPPEYFIPPVPDYPSTHTVLGAAAAEVLRETFGDDLCFSATSGSLAGVTRHYRSLTQAAVENGLSRVYGGIHFVRAVVDGYRQGTGIGRAVAQLLPVVR
jgi:hypothetical protein